MKTPHIFLSCAATLLLVACDDSRSSPIERQAGVAARCAERPSMPEGEYKVGAAALADIRAIYDAAARREGFGLSASKHRMLSAYLLTGDARQATKSNFSLLHLACFFNCPALVAELIERGADVNAATYYLPDYFETTESGDVWRLAPVSAFFFAASPCFYKGNATAENSIAIIDMLLAAGADPLLGDSPLPYVAEVEHDRMHAQEVFLHLLDCGFTLEGERRSPELSPEYRARLEKSGLRPDEARISPRHREGTINCLKMRREFGSPWEEAEKRLGIPAGRPEP